MEVLKKNKNIIIVVLIAIVLCILLAICFIINNFNNKEKDEVTINVKTLIVNGENKIGNYEFSNFTIERLDDTQKISFKVKNIGTEATQDDKRIILELLDVKKRVISIIDIWMDTIEPYAECTIDTEVSNEILGIAGCQVNDYLL